MRESDLFNKLNIFFTGFKGNAAAEVIKEKFFSCLEGMSNRKGLCDQLGSLKSLYESAIRLTEKESADKGFGEGLLCLQRELYRERRRQTFYKTIQVKKKGQGSRLALS